MAISEFTKLATSQQDDRKKKPSRFTREVSTFLQPAPRKQFDFSPTGGTKPPQFDFGTRATTPQTVSPDDPSTLVSRFTKEVAQGFARSGLGTLAGFRDITKISPDVPRTPKDRLRSFVDAEFDPQDKFTQAITGREEPFTLRQEGEETLTGFGAKEETAIKGGGILGGAIAFLDFTPIGRGARSMAKITREVLGKKSADETTQTLVRLGVDENLARSQADNLVKISDEAELQRQLTDIFDTQNAVAAKRAGEIAARTSDEATIQNALQDAGIKRSQARKLAPKLTSETDPIIIARQIAPESIQRAEARGLFPTARTTPDIPPQLAEEARKFDTTEEFVEAQRNPLREFETLRTIEDPDIARGTVREAIEDIGGINNVRRGDVAINKLETTENINTGSVRFKNVKEEVESGVITPIIADENLRILDGHHRLKVYQQMGMDNVPVVVPKTTAGVKFQTKSQLTDIFNRVKGGDEVAGAPRASKRQEITDRMENTARRREQAFRDEASARQKQPTRQEGKTLKLVSAKEEPRFAGEFSSSYSKGYDNTISKAEKTEFVKELHPLEPKNPEKWTKWANFRHKTSNVWTSVRENIQDDFIRVRNLVQSEEAKITKGLNPYQAEILFHGRVGSRLEDTRLQVIEIDKDIVSTAKVKNVDPEEFSSEVNAYLHARHAPERNKQLGDGAAGISTKEAKKITKEIEDSDIGGEVKRVADKIQELNNRTLNILREGEVISDDLYKTLTERYKNHVPLQRVMDGEENIGDVISGRGFDVRSTGIKRARGSEREVSDIFTSVVANFEQAVARAEKNRVDLATLHFARENKKEFGHIFEEIKPKVVGKTFDDKPILERITDPQVLALRENGKPVYLKIKDPNLAVTLKGVSRQKLDGVFRYVAAITRFYSGLQTRFNPEFAFPNKIRDIQEATIYAASKKDVGFKGAYRIAGKELRLQNEGAVLDWLRSKDSEGARMYQQMRQDGGTTGGLGLSTRMEVELDIEKIKKINRSDPRKAADLTVRYVDNWNRIFEDSTRLSVYRQAIEQGATREKAAILAKTSSVNFNKTGRAGPIINGFYMFANASIQGSTKMLGAMKNPKVAATVIGGVGVAVAAQNEWNDAVDENWREKLPEWDRLNSFVVVLPTEDEKFSYVAVPASWGIKPIKVMMDKGYDLMAGKGEGLLDAADSIFVSIIESYNPAGGTDYVSAITPTILDLPVDVARNRAWHGGKIKPDWDRNAPDSIQYFESLEDTTTGRTFVGLSKGLSGVGLEVSPANMNYSYEQIVGGAGRTGSEFLNTLIGIATNDIPPVRDIPVLGRFLRSRTGEEVGAGSLDYEKIKEVLEEQSRERFLLKQEAEDAYQQLSNIPKEDAVRLFNDIQQNDPDLADKIREIKEQEDKNLTYVDRMLLQLGVGNGARARFLVQKFNSLDSDRQRAELWSEYRQKGVISDRVAEQIKFLLKEKQTE